MHALLAIIGTVFSALSRFCAALSEHFTALANSRLGLFGLAAIIVTSLLIAASCSTWAIIERWRRSDYRARVQAVLRRAQLARRFRDSILDSLPEMVVVLRSRIHSTLGFGGGSAVLQRCLEGPDASPLAVAIDDLLHHGSGFSLSIRLSASRQIFVRGLRIGDGEVLFLRAQDRVNGEVPVRPQAPQIVYRPMISSVVAGSTLPATIPAASTASRVGEIIIGPDGRLKHHDQGFARLWPLRDGDLRNQPLWTELASRCIARDGHDALWDIVSYATTLADPERLNEWGFLLRGNGERLSLAISRLPDGATRVVFTESAVSAEKPPNDTSGINTAAWAA